MPWFIRFSFIAALLAAAPALANDISNGTWSPTDASNTAASPNGFPPNMPSNQVAPSVRAIMGAVKRWYNRANATITSGGSANTQTLTYSVPPTACVAGDGYTFIAGFTNTGATTLNNGACTAAVKVGASALTGGEITAGRVTSVYYDGTAFQLLNPSASSTVAATAQGGTGYGGPWTAGAIPFLSSTTQFGQDAGNLFWDGTNHRLGVGTNTPAERLHIKDTTSRLSFTGTGKGAILVEGAGGDGQYIPVDFNNTDTTNPIARVGAKVTSSGTYFLIGTSNNYSAGITNNGLMVNPGGNVIAQTLSVYSSFVSTAGSSTVCMIGNLYEVGWSALTLCASDARLKTPLEPLDANARAAVNKLNPGKFTFKDDPDHKLHSGFTAQDVAEAIPEAVTTNQDGKLSIETNAVLAYAVKALQDDDRRIKALERAIILGWVVTAILIFCVGFMKRRPV